LQFPTTPVASVGTPGVGTPTQSMLMQQNPLQIEVQVPTAVSDGSIPISQAVPTCWSSMAGAQQASTYQTTASINGDTSILHPNHAQKLPETDHVTKTNGIEYSEVKPELQNGTVKTETTEQQAS